MIAFKLRSQNLGQAMSSYVQNQQRRFVQVGTVAQKLMAYLQTNLRCFMQEPQLFVMRKLARFEGVRQGYLWLSHARPETYETEQASILGEIDPEAIANQIKQDGCAPGLKLPADAVQQILAFAATEPCYANRNPEMPFQLADQAAMESRLAESGQPLIVAGYMGNHEAVPVIRQLLDDPGLLAIAAHYFGRQPFYVISELAWSFPTPTTLFQQLRAAQVFHCDIDDYSCIKFFFYLTDVDEQSGPHIYLRASHKNKPLIHQILGQRCASLPDQVLVERYGSENVMPLCGSAGYGFVEDIFGFHKGSPPETCSRLMLQIEFATHAYKNLRSCGQ